MKEKFEDVIAKNKDSIFRICKVYASEPYEPMDLFQEVTFQAWKSYEKFRGDSNVSTWIYRVALNVCMQMKNKYEKVNQLTTKLDAVQVIMNDDHDPVQVERFIMLKQCIDQLNERDRSIIVLFLEDLAYREIGEITGLSENHVAVKMKRIKAKLTECMTSKMHTNA